MKKLLLSAVLLFVAGCQTLQLVNPYDPVIDSGIKEYKESINLFAKNMADAAGTAAGTYENNLDNYNVLETKIDLLIDRATIQSNGKGCQLTVDVGAKVSEIMGDKDPPRKESGDSYGCTERLLVLVKEQLATLQTIHETTDKCQNKEAADPAQISCLRPATSETAMKITNQSINAAWVVETAKKTEKEK
ncbi:MAG: hypothetical protein AMJ53_01235 [Gammaproteobacteria bacterium SG8_11]|nr:MAG: hypothetical protein AMJ53_01235 [Gammaproteobacteria bacterium SG8_11]